MCLTSHLSCANMWEISLILSLQCYIVAIYVHSHNPQCIVVLNILKWDFQGTSEKKSILEKKFRLVSSLQFGFIKRRNKIGIAHKREHISPQMLALQAFLHEIFRWNMLHKINANLNGNCSANRTNATNAHDINKVWNWSSSLLTTHKTYI